MTDHFIVCGMGQVGYRVVELLRRLGEPTSVITLDSPPHWVRAVSADGVRILMGDGRDRNLLDEAGLGSARALIALTDHDPANIEIALGAREVYPELPIVVRMFDQELAHQIEFRLGVRRAIGMSALSAPAFAAAALGEQMLASFAIDDALFGVGRIEAGTARLSGRSLEGLPAGRSMALLGVSSEDGLSLAPSQGAGIQQGDRLIVVGPAAEWNQITDGGAPHPIRSTERSGMSRPGWWKLPSAGAAWASVPLPLRLVLTVLAAVIAVSVLIFSWAMNLTLVDAVYFIITTVTTTGYGDITPRDASDALKLYAALIMVVGSISLATLYAIVTDFVLTARFRQLLGRGRIPHQGHVIVVGLGNVGYRVVDEIHRLGAKVVAVDRNPAAEFLETVQDRTPVIVGDARLGDTLSRAGVERARAIIAATGDDVVNLGASLSAKQRNPNLRTVVRLFDADFAAKVRATFALDAVMSGSRIAAPTFVAAALYEGVLSAFVLDGYLVAILHRSAGDRGPLDRPDEAPPGAGWAVLMTRASPSLDFAPATGWDSSSDEEALLAIWRPLRD